MNEEELENLSQKIQDFFISLREKNGLTDIKIHKIYEIPYGAPQEIQQGHYPIEHLEKVREHVKLIGLKGEFDIR